MSSVHIHSIYAYIQPWCTPFPIFNQSIVPRQILTVAFSPVYKFLRRQVRWSSIPIEEFSTVYCDPHKGFSVVNEVEVDVFLEFPCFFCDPTDVSICSLIPLPFLNPPCASGSSLFMYCWSIAWIFWALPCYHVKWYDCAVLWTFFGFPLLWDWNENWPFPVLWPLLSFPNLLPYSVRHFSSIIF